MISCQQFCHAGQNHRPMMKELCTKHQLVPEGLPENSAANLHGIAVVRVRLKNTNATWQKKVFLHRGKLKKKVCTNRQEMS